MGDEYEVVFKNLTDTSEVPKDKDLSYRCSICGGVIPSIPRDNMGCECGNVFIDIDYWRLVIGDYEKFEVVKKRRRK